MKATPDEIKKSLRMCTEYKDANSCFDCYYDCFDSYCSAVLTADALAYIEQLENRAEPKNRVLTMEELKAYCEGGADAAPLWYDSKDYSDVNRWMVIDLPKHAFGSAATVNCFVNGHFFEPTYGEEWRCWLRKPTEAERRGTPWAGDSHE